MKSPTAYSHANKKQQTIMLFTEKKIHFVKVKNIIRCKADGGYTKFVFAFGKKITVSKNLKYFESKLTSFDFFRTHQSHLINLDYLDHYHKNQGGYLVMQDGKKIPLAQRKKKKFIKLVHSIYD